MLKRQVAFLVSLACFLVPVGVFAQGSLGTITGTITDTSGAVIPNAAITITEVNTGVARTIASSSAGYYRISVPPGTYRIETTREGFKAGIVDNVIVPVAQIVTENVTLEVGQVRQSVTVTSAAPLLTPDTAMISTSMSPKEFANLPLPAFIHPVYSPSAYGKAIPAQCPSLSALFPRKSSELQRLSRYPYTPPPSLSKIR